MYNVNTKEKRVFQVAFDPSTALGSLKRNSELYVGGCQ